MEYQNIFTQVQVQGPAEMGVDPTGTLAAERTKSASFSTIAGLFGNAGSRLSHLRKNTVWALPRWPKAAGS